MANNSSNKKKKLTDQEKIDAGYTPIDDILKQNEEIVIDDGKDNEKSSLGKNFLSGLVSGIATAPSSLVALGEAFPRTVEALTTAAIDPNVTLKDALIKSLVENKSLEFTGKLDDTIRQKISGKTYEELNPNEQLASLGGELFPLLASGGSKGLVKVGNTLRKSAVKAAKKEAVKSGKALSSEAIKKAQNKADFATGLLLPGVQVTKDAKLGQQLAEVGVQTAIPLGINELTRYGLQQEGIIGDYSPTEKENITIINDKRKIGKKKFIEDLPQGTVSSFEIENKKQEEENKSNMLSKTALVGAGILGSAAAIRKLRNLVSKETDLLKNLEVNNTKSTLDLSFADKSDMVIADRFAFKDKAVENGLLSQETANELARDTNSFINAAYNVGDLGDGIKLKVAPQQTYNKLQALKLTRPKDYNIVENFLEISSNIEDEANRFNKFKNNSKLTTDDYIKNVLFNEVNDNDISKFYSDSRTLANSLQKRQKLLNYINKDSQLKEVLDEISEIGQALLTKIEKSGMESAADIEYLRKNRTISDLFLYKPRIGNNKPTLKERLSNYFVDRTPYNKNGIANNSERGENFIENSKNYLDIMEDSFKSKLLEIYENNIKVKSIDDMVNGSFKKINESLDDFDVNFQKFSEDLSKGEIRDIKGLIRKTENDISKLFVAKPLGKMRINDYGDIEISEPKSLFSLLNRNKNPKNELHNNLDIMFSPRKGELSKNLSSYRDSKDVISYRKGGYEYFYRVDPIIKAAFDLNPTLPSVFAENMKTLKNVVQTTITGKLNPAFSIPSSLMSTHEALTVLPRILQKLEYKDDFSRLQYLREFGKSYLDILTNDVSNQIVSMYNKEFIRSKGELNSLTGKLLSNINVKKFEADLKKSLLTEIQLQGGASAKPYTTNSGTFYSLTKDTKLSEATEKLIVKNFGVNGAVQFIKLFNYLQQALREAPSLALTRYVGKKVGAITDNKIIDNEKMANIIRVISDNTANIGKKGTSKGFSGGVASFISNYVPYGDIMFKSIAPKVRASGITKGIENIAKVTKDLYDPKVRYIDILSESWKHSKDFVNNGYVQGLVIASIIPSIINYVWNYGSRKNMNDYHSLSDYDKASKFILTNALGEGRHLIIPKDQEVALVDNIVTTVLDNILGMSRYNEVDPAFDNSRLVMQSLARSVGVDSIPLLDIIANTSGYDINLNLLDDKPFVSSLSRNKINSDLSETAYENGLVNQETTSLVNSLSGVVGSAILGSFEEANVGARNDTGLEDFGSSLFDRMTKSARIITSTKAISSFNETSKDVYNKRNIYNKIKSISEKNPKQKQVYDFVRIYKRNRIDPVHDNITALRKEISFVKSTGRLSDGSIAKYNDRREAINELNKTLQKLFVREYHEFNNLDKLIEQMYGKDINMENFMEKFNE